MGKPRIIETRDKKKPEKKDGLESGGQAGADAAKDGPAPRKPKVVEERDYSLLLEREEPDNLILGKRKVERHETVDSARDRMREDMLADITPVSPPLGHDELERKIGEDLKKRHAIGKKLKKFVGLE
jgi:hypothetical protein